MLLSGFPLEIHLRILQLCSRPDLAALSRAHTSLRDVAEYDLYHHIHFHKQPTDMAIFKSPSRCSDPVGLKEDRSLLHTLVASPRKASMVKIFSFELDYPIFNLDSEVIPFILAKLGEALEKTCNLRDFRVVYIPTGSLPEGRISQVIRFVIVMALSRWLAHSLAHTGVVTLGSTSYIYIIFMASRKLLPSSPIYGSSESATSPSTTRMSWSISGQKSTDSTTVQLAAEICP